MANLFQNHSRDFEGNRYVYPVVSRRSRGLSIGLDLTPQCCSFRCVYCSELRGQEATAPARPIDLPLLRQELTDMLSFILSGAIFQQPPFDETPQTHRRLNDIALSGSGEPTLSPSFEVVCELIDEVLEAEARWCEPKVVLITNATGLHLPAVQRGLALLDRARVEIWTKLDAGTAAHYALVNRSKVPFEKVLDNLLTTGRRRGITIQTLFGALDGQPPSEQEIAAWLGRLKWLESEGAQIDGVQIYTVARATRETSIQALPDAVLQAIAARVQALGLKADWFGSGG
ncbi:MAG: hypothetical protein LBM75_01715 [Myxococcales bacterium]|jgi:wyosine [tRNA(Phe)-imidazoG37] synthetase (radical SAM superfamily)|nr:hypothetical protein [Myxococcales bacterium]